MLVDSLKQKIAQSLKKGDSVVVETLRYLIAAVNNTAIAKYGSESEAKLTDADVLDVIKKQVRTHTESIEAFTKGERLDLVEKEKAQLAILESYLPKQISDEELKKLLEPVAAQGGDFGPLMGKAMAAVAGLPAQAGKADGGRISALLKQMLQEKQ